MTSSCAATNGLPAARLTASPNSSVADIWFNCAARMLVRPLEQMTEADWSSVLQVNLTGYFLGCKAAAARMTDVS